MSIQKVIDSADILDIVSESVELKKSGSNYKGLCPFHSESTPSFIVSPKKGIFKCISCTHINNFNLDTTRSDNNCTIQ